jgi:uncharacterized protein (TIGR02996 family)
VDPQALIDAIVRDPYGPGWAVYADWLLERGDPRGELIALADRDDARVREILADDERLMSPRLREQAQFWQLRWRRGFIDAASPMGAPDDPPTVEAVAALVADPHAGLLRELVLGPADAQARFDAAFVRPRPTLRTLEVSSRVDLAALATAAPALERLILDGDRPVPRLAHPHIRELDAGAATAVRDGELPRLHKLNWGPHADADDPLFAPGSILDAPALDSLWLSWPMPTAIPALARAAVAARLDTLSIEGATFETVGLLIAHALAFLGLRYLEIHPHPFERMSIGYVEATRARLAAAFPDVAIEADWRGVTKGVEPPSSPHVESHAYFSRRRAP